MSGYYNYVYILCAQGSEPEVLISAEHPVPVRVKRTYCSTHPSFRLVITQGNDKDSTQVIAKVNYMYNLLLCLSIVVWDRLSQAIAIISFTLESGLSISQTLPC